MAGKVAVSFDLLNHAVGIFVVNSLRFFSVLPTKINLEAEHKAAFGKSPINSPEDAVKAAIAAVYKAPSNGAHLRLQAI